MGMDMGMGMGTGTETVGNTDNGSREMDFTMVMTDVQ